MMHGERLDDYWHDDTLERCVPLVPVSCSGLCLDPHALQSLGPFLSTAFRVATYDPSCMLFFDTTILCFGYGSCRACGAAAHLYELVKPLNLEIHVRYMVRLHMNNVLCHEQSSFAT